MTSRRDQPSPAQSESALLDMGRAQRHQSFAQTIADKYRFVRRDDRGRLSLTFREKGAAAAALPPASITTVVQQVQLKLGLLMPMQVQLESIERRWLVQVERWLRGTDRSFDRVVKRVGQKLREDERREHSAAGNRTELNSTASRQAAHGIPFTRSADGSRERSNPLSGGERGRAFDAPFIHAAPRDRQEDADGTRSAQRDQEIRVERQRVERVEDLLERSRVEWRRAMRLTAMPASSADNRRLEAEFMRKRSGGELTQMKANQDPHASREIRSHATVVLHRYLRMLDSRSPLAAEGSMQARRPGVIRNERVAQNDASIHGSFEAGEALPRRARIVQTPTNRDFSLEVRSRMERSMQGSIAENSVQASEIGTANRGPRASFHSTWSAQLVHAVLGRLAGERSATIRPFLNRAMDTSRTIGEHADTGRAARRQLDDVANPPRNRTASPAHVSEYRGAQRQDASTNRDAWSEQNSRNDARQETAAPLGSVSRMRSEVDAAQSVTATTLGSTLRMQSGVYAPPLVKAAPMQLRLVRRPHTGLESRDRRTKASAIEHIEHLPGKDAQSKPTNRPDTKPALSGADADKQALPSKALAINGDIAHQAAESGNGDSRQSMPQLKRTLPNGHPDLSVDRRNEGMLPAFRRRDAESRLTLSRWQLVELTPAMAEPQVNQKEIIAYKPVRSTMLVQRIQSRGERDSRTSTGQDMTSSREANPAARGGIRFFVKQVHSTGSLERERAAWQSSAEPAARSWVTTASVPQIQRFKHRLRPQASTAKEANGILSQGPFTSKPLLKGLQSLIHKNSSTVTDLAPDDSAVRRPTNGASDIAKHPPRVERSLNDVSVHDAEHPSALTSVNGSKRGLPALPPHSPVHLIFARRQAVAVDISSANERAASSSAEKVGEIAKRVIAQRAASATGDFRDIRVIQQQSRGQIQGRQFVSQPGSSSADDARTSITRVRGTITQPESGTTAPNTAVQQHATAKNEQADYDVSIAVRARLNVRRIQQHMPLLPDLISEGMLSRGGFEKGGRSASLVHILARRLQADGEEARLGHRTDPLHELPVQTVRIHLRRGLLNAEGSDRTARQNASHMPEHGNESVAARGSNPSSERVDNPAGPSHAARAKGTLSSPSRQEQQPRHQTAELARLTFPASLSFVFAAAARNAARLRTGSTAGRFAGWNKGTPLSARQGAKQNDRTQAGQAISRVASHIQPKVDQPQAQKPAGRSVLSVNAIHRIFRQYGQAAIASLGNSVRVNTATAEAASALNTRKSRPGTLGDQNDFSRNPMQGNASVADNRFTILDYRLPTAEPVHPNQSSRARGGMISNALTHRTIVVNGNVQFTRSLNAGIARGRGPESGSAANRQTAGSRIAGSQTMSDGSSRSARLTSLQHTLQRRSSGLSSNLASSGIADVNSASVNLTDAVQRRNRGYANAGRHNPTTSVQPANAQDVELAMGQAAGRQTAASSPAMHYSAARPQASAASNRSAIQPAMMQHAAKTQPASAQPAQPVKTMEPARTPAIDPAQLQQALNQLPQLQPDVIAGKVMTAIEKKMKFQQRTRGY
ncbi:hypothetical protein [Paenibacillus methanolicus]|uniref:Uncharacterized protein n=1 Tax=Paenibacillus methanolicus TaxID=582686 RepID=A0A5S5CIZ3_9BACL|nr:hypothetical protein [Paenibacillus methanolicus]TYP79672.1 hypothetical protein BCM02_101793 [Paenibacillus methanolicus]